MQFKNILVPYDGSPHSRDALRVAKGFLDDGPDVTLHLVTVVETELVDPPVDYDALGTGMLLNTFDPQEYQDFSKLALDRAKDQAAAGAKDVMGDSDAYGTRLVIEAIAGVSPAAGIKDYASDHACDLIVMGRRGLGKIRSLLGSVSTGVLHEVDIPVLTVK